MFENQKHSLKVALSNSLIPKAALKKFPNLKEYNRARPQGFNRAFCNAPATNMYFSQTGEVKVCCHNMEFTAGKYPEQTLEQIWNSPEAESMRQAMREYKLEGGCEICADDLRTGSFEEVRARHFDNIPAHAKYPTQMEFLLTNTCNLECVMCKGEFSSSIRQNREGLPPIKNVYDDAFIEQLKPFIPYLHETRFSGSGEAFLIEQNYKIWELIIAINPSCKIMIQSNGTVLNSRIKALLERGHFQLGVSLDSLQQDVFETIRPNAKFERVMENITYFSNYSRERKRKFNISTCVMRQNRMELPAFLEFSNSIGAVQNFHKVWHPREHAVFNLPTCELNEIYSHLERYKPTMDSPLKRLNGQHYLYFVDVVKGWWQDAVQQDEVKQKQASLSPKALRQIIHEKMSNYVQQKWPNDAPQANIKLCYYEERIAQLLAAMPDETAQELSLKQMAYTQIEDLMNGINLHDTATLINMSKTHLSDIA